MYRCIGNPLALRFGLCMQSSGRHDNDTKAYVQLWDGGTQIKSNELATDGPADRATKRPTDRCGYVFVSVYVMY